MVLEYLVSNGVDCSWVVVLEGVVDLSILVLAIKVIFWVVRSVWDLMSIGDVVLGDIQLMLPECAVDGPCNEAFGGIWSCNNCFCGE